MKKFTSFLFKFIIVILIFTIILAVLYYLNSIYKVVDFSIDHIMQQLSQINNVFFMRLAAGITVGTILLLVFIFIFPFFTSKINTKEYLKNIILGVVASFVFFISQTIFQYFEKLGNFYLIVSIVAVIFITIFIVELMSLAFNSEKKGVEFRTSVLGCIASGLIFGIVLNVVFVVMESLKISIK
jgi:hypothetical protein